MSETSNALPPDDDTAEISDSSSEPFGIKHLAWKGILLESALLAIALIVGFFGFCQSTIPFSDLLSVNIESAGWESAGWGLAAVVPLFLMLLIVDRSPFRPCLEIQTVGDQLLEPLFRHIPLWQLALISISAGIGEEMFFRWMLQGGIHGLIQHETTGIIVSVLVVSILFGLCHWLNLVYAIFAFAVGIYLGLLMIITDSIIAPIVTHAAYDLVALIYLTRIRRKWRGIDSTS